MENTKLIIAGLNNIDLLTLQAQLDELNLKAQNDQSQTPTSKQETIQYAFDAQTVVIAISVSQFLITALRVWIKSGKKPRAKGAEFKIEYPDGTVITISKEGEKSKSADHTFEGASQLLSDLQDILKDSMS